jgi:hypothetical protein
MDTNELLHESFDYDNFFGENTDNYHTMTSMDSVHLTNENLLNLNESDAPMKNRTTGSLFI